MLDRRGTSRIVIAGGVLIVLAFIIFFLAANFSGSAAQVVVPLLILAVVFNGLVLGIFAAMRRGYVKRTPEGALEAARWAAFRRYLKDFSRLQEAPAISLALWDRFLVYAIGFGLAEEVLEAARLASSGRVADGVEHLLVRRPRLHGGWHRECFLRIDLRPQRRFLTTLVGQRRGRGILRWWWRRRRRWRRRRLVRAPHPNLWDRNLRL